MNKAKKLIFAAFTLVFVAGVPFGWALERSFDSSAGGSWLTRKLDLTPEQEQQINGIWSEVAREPHAEGRAHMGRLSEVRDNEIRALLSEEQVAGFDRILEKYQEARSEYFQEIRARNDAAVEKTKAVLSEQQRQKYEALLDHRRSRDMRMLGFGRRPGHEVKPKAQ